MKDIKHHTIRPQGTAGQQRDTVRHNRLTLLVSDDELRIIDSYLNKNKITNKSHWMRQTLLASIHKELEENYPTLFNEHDMRR